MRTLLVVVYPLSVDENGIKMKPEHMEKEKMYYCLHDEKVILVYKDDQEFLNCYEIEEKDLVDSVKTCSSPDEIEQIIESYIRRENIKH